MVAFQLADRSILAWLRVGGSLKLKPPFSVLTRFALKKRNLERTRRRFFFVLINLLSFLTMFNMF